MRACIALTAFFCTSAFAGPVTAQPALLRWRFAVDDHLDWTANQVIQSTRRVSGGNAPHLTTRVETRVTWNWRVLRVTDETTAIEQDVTAIRVSMNVADGKPLVFDSSQPLAADAAPAVRDLQRSFQPWLGKQSLAISSSGEIRLAAPPQAADNAAETRAAPMGLLPFLKSVMLPLPGKPVAPQATWRHQSESAGPSGTLALRRTFRFDSLQGGSANISMTGVIVMRPLAHQAGPQPLQLTDQKHSGDYQFEVNTGTLTSIAVKQSMATRRGLQTGVEYVVTTSEMNATAKREQSQPGPR